MASEIEIAAMRRAIELAARGLTTTLPNPVVGCVLLAPDGTVAGEGWHERAGGPHAEVAALRNAGELPAGSTAVVTQEPCSHHGRTGPCTEALLAAGVRRVVFAVHDPSTAGGGGGDRLRAAGVDVESGVLVQEAEAGNEPWLVATRLGRPFVTWKLAASLDGRVAAADGSSHWITGEESRRDGHRLRAEVDTMLVGVGTVLADDPQLTARDDDGRLLSRQPLRVVADSTGRTPREARVLDDSAPTWIATTAELGSAGSSESARPTGSALGDLGGDPVGRGIDPVGRGDGDGDGVGRVDLRALMDRLYARERRHVLLEGGPRLAGAMIEAGLVDRVVAYLAPALLGAGPNALAEAGITTLAAARRLEFLDVRQVGSDVRVLARPLSVASTILSVRDPGERPPPVADPGSSQVRH